MLCDEFYPAIDQMRALRAPNWMIDDMRQFAEAVSSAQRFVFDEVSAEAAGNISFRRPSSIRDALKFARAPSTTTWIEMAWSHSLSLRVSATNTKTSPKRIGYLIVTDETCAVGQIVIAWQHAGTVPTINPIGFIFDFQPSPTIGEMSHAGSGRAPQTAGEMQSAFAGNARLEGFVRSDLEVGALREMQGRYGVLPALYQEGFWTHEGSHRSDAHIESYLEDIQGESTLATAFMLVIQCRNVVSIERQDHAKLNKSRVRSGKLPLYTYNHVTLKLDEKRAASAKRSGLSPQEIRRHFVRGHFKTRKSGVFFWTPYFRGNAELGFADKDYQVKR